MTKQELKAKLEETYLLILDAYENTPTLDKDWGIDDYVPNFIRDFYQLEKAINFSTRGTTFYADTILSEISDDFIEREEELYFYFLGKIDSLPEGEVTAEEVSYYHTYFTEPFFDGFEDYLEIVEAFVEDKCYAFKYNW